MTQSKSQPRRKGHLPTGDGHWIYFEQWGATDAVPVVYLHGGPGSGCAPGAHALFDQRRLAPVFIDQRGAGLSRPAGALENNHTDALVDDLERVREALGIERWIVFGGSWGATLALCYAQAYPHRVMGMVLRGVFLARPCDIRWFFGAEGVARLFPHEYERFLDGLQGSEREDPPAAYSRRLASTDWQERVHAAHRWWAWEDTVVRHGLQQITERDTAGGGVPSPERLVQRASIATHYACKGFFLGPQGAVTRPERLRGIAGCIVHGALDLVCPVENAWTLHRLWPEAELQILEDCGHAVVDPRMREALVAALERILSQCGAH